MREALLLSIGRLVCTTPWFIICCVPFYPQRRISRSAITLIITLASIVFFCCNFFLQLWRTDYVEYGGLVFGVLYVVMLGFFLWGFRAAPVKLLYVFLVVQAISTALNYMAAILLHPFYSDVRISLQNIPSYTLIILLLTLVAFPILLHFFTHQLCPALDALYNRDFWMLCIPPALMFLVTMIFNDMATNPAIPQVQAMGIFLLITAAGLATYFVSIRLALNTARRIRLELEMDTMNRQLTVQTQSYIQLTQSIEAARAARHDLHHHLAVMSGFVQQKDWYGLSVYLSEYEQTLHDEQELRVCDNDTVDAVVRYYLNHAKACGAELDVKLALPEKLGILDTDLTIVFGNLFENAAQAVAGQTDGRRFITARCGVERHKLILTVDNSVEPAVRHSNVIPHAPGIGQSSVTAVAEKYQGVARFSQDMDAYRASVYMIIPQL